jgi:hypothetical protein
MIRARLRTLLAASLLACLCASAQAAPAGEVIAQIARQFDQHPLVMIGELHRFAQLHAFIQQLIHDPAFICRADDVVIEFGNSRLQPLADRWAAGGELTEAQLQSMWRETVVPFTWNSPLYRQFYEAIREINLKHLCTHPIRLVLGDVPLDWSQIKTAKEYVPFADRDASLAEVVEREVLARRHHAFVLAGEAHALKRQPKRAPGAEEPAAAELLERRHPGALFVIVPVRSAADGEALKMGPPPGFKVVRGTGLERAVFSDYFWKEQPVEAWPKTAEVIDGVLYVGEQTLWYPSPQIYLEPAYQQELRRRITIIKEWSGQDFITGLDELIEKGKQEQR